MANNKRLAMITADLHLDDYAWADRPTLSGDSRWSFQWICDKAEKFGNPSAASPSFCVIAAGDLVEKKRNESGPVHFIRRRMEQLENGDPKSVGFYYIQGQHDMQDEPWFGSAHRWPEHIHEPSDGYCYDLGGYKLWGIDWTPPDRLQEALDRVPEDTDILVMHQVCHEFMGSVAAPELSFDRIPHARLLIVGDYHKRVKLETRGAHGQKLTVLSPGSTNLREISEQRDKAVFMLYEDLSVKVAKIPTRAVIETPDLLMEEAVEDLLEELDTLIDAAQVRAVKAGLPVELHRPIIYVRYHRRLVGTEPRLLKAIDRRAHLFTKVIGELAEGEEGESEELDLGEEGLTLLGCLPEEVDEDQEPGVFEGLQRLLSTDEPAVELSKMRAEHLDA